MVSNNYRAFGRTISHEGVLYLGYSASGVSFVTASTDIYAEIVGVSEPGGICEAAYLGVFINGDKEAVCKIKVRHGRHRYRIFSQETKEEVRIAVIKLSEAQYDKVGIAGIDANDEIRPTQEESGSCSLSEILFQLDLGSEAGEKRSFLQLLKMRQKRIPTLCPKC